MIVLGMTPCVTETDPRAGLVFLDRSLIVKLDAGLSLFLPKGMRSDGASVPAPLWAVLDASPVKLLTMGVIHDGAYRKDAAWGVLGGQPRALTRPEADDLARAVALWSGCSELDGAKIRWGLGVGGADSWHQKSLNWLMAARPV